MRDYIRSYKELLRHLEEGGSVMLTRGEGEHRRSWSDPLTGRMIDARLARKAIREERMMPCDDGLFGDAQTWVRPSIDEDMDEPLRSQSELAATDAGRSTCV